MAGTEAVTLEDACKLCKQYNINLYAYCPSVEMNIYTSKEKIASYKKAVKQLAGGKFYTGALENNISSIVYEIKETKKTLQKTSKKTFVTDQPEVFFICIVVIYTNLIILEKRTRV